MLAAAAPPLISICLLGIAMPWKMAIHGTLGMWPALLAGNVSSQLFYRHSMGLDDLAESLRPDGAWIAAWSIPIAGFAAWAVRPKPARRTPALLIAFLIGAIFTGWRFWYVDWGSMFRPLPLVATIVIAASVIQYFRGHAEVHAGLRCRRCSACSACSYWPKFFFTRESFITGAGWRCRRRCCW